MTPYLLSHWNDPAATGRKCFQCSFAANHSGHTPLAKSEDVIWLCLNHACAWANERGVAMPINCRSAGAPPAPVTATFRRR